MGQIGFPGRCGVKRDAATGQNHPGQMVPFGSIVLYLLSGAKTMPPPGPWAMAPVLGSGTRTGYIIGMKMIANRFIAAAFIALAFVLPHGAWAQGAVAFAKSKLTIVTAAGDRQFNIELAETDAQRGRGLMFRREMAADAGMLFDYARPQRVTMWMRNTILPLDMLFIDKTGRITRIAERTVPQSETLISSRRRVLGVLELNAGTAKRLGIKPGDRVLHRIFKTR